MGRGNKIFILKMTFTSRIILLLNFGFGVYGVQDKVVISRLINDCNLWSKLNISNLPKKEFFRGVIQEAAGWRQSSKIFSSPSHTTQLPVPPTQFFVGMAKIRGISIISKAIMVAISKQGRKKGKIVFEEYILLNLKICIYIHVHCLYVKEKHCRQVKPLTLYLEMGRPFLNYL